MKRSIQVVAAVIERDGKILIGQRRREDRHAYKWEFPGGKVEAGENPRDALQRELEEELAIQAHIGPELRRLQFQYPKRLPIQIIFYRVERFAGEPRNSAFEQIVWAEPAMLPDYDFLDADIEFVKELAQGLNSSISSNPD